jgi:hypothetical protein
VAPSLRAQQTAEEMDPGRWCVPEEVGRHPQRDGPTCYTCTAQETRLPGTREGQCCTSNPERTDARKGTSGESERKQRHNELRSIGTATSEEGEDIRQEFQDVSRAGDRQADNRDFH